MCGSSLHMAAVVTPGQSAKHEVIVSPDSHFPFPQVGTATAATAWSCFGGGGDGSIDRFGGSEDADKTRVGFAGTCARALTI